MIGPRQGWSPSNCCPSAALSSRVTTPPTRWVSRSGYFWPTIVVSRLNSHAPGVTLVRGGSCWVVRFGMTRLVYVPPCPWEHSNCRRDSRSRVLKYSKPYSNRRPCTWPKRSRCWRTPWMRLDAGRSFVLTSRSVSSWHPQPRSVWQLPASFTAWLVRTRPRISSE